MTETRAAYETLRLVGEIEVPGLPPASQSPNWRGHYMVRANDRKEYMAIVANAVLVSGLKDVRLPWARVEMEFIVVENRRRDYDNWTIRGMKPIGDVLVQMGVILDDDSKHLDVCVPTFTVDPVRAPLTAVRIWGRDEVG